MSEVEAKLAKMLEDYHRRRALGQNPTAKDYREQAGEAYDEFRGVLEAEVALDEAMDPETRPVLPLPFGDYTLLRELGRGGMGVVYEALHRELGRKVALKVMKTGFDTSPASLERFRREARAIAQIRHDNIVDVYEVGETDDRPFYAMSLVEGRSLAELAKTGELPAPLKLAAAMADVADALHHLHEKGIVHRDVKPGNIMVEPSGRLVLADFGIARALQSESITATGESLGTPLYMSPEQLLGERSAINGRTDVYALGATLYELWGGRRVFEADDVRELIRCILTERPRPLREIAPSLPRGCSDLVLKALEKENADRYESAAAMRDDLRALAHGSRVRGRPTSRFKRGRRWARRSWLPLATAAAVITSISVFAALQPPEPAEVAIACVPVAQVWINGEDHGTTPIRDLKVAPGTYELILRRAGWKERRLPLKLSEGAQWRKEFLLQPEDPGDPAALEILAQEFELQMEKWEEAERQRGAIDDRAIQILYPRGSVRLEDLDSYRFDVGAAFDQEGAIVFKVGEKTLYERALTDEWPEMLRSVQKLPELALEAGATITWGFFPKEGRPVTATFTVVERDLAGKVAALHDRFKELDHLIRMQLEAQILLDAGLDWAAYTKARAVTDKLQKAPKPHAIMKTALERLDLRDTALWNEFLRNAPR
jgi:serine/threonine protein kinase